MQVRNVDTESHAIGILDVAHLDVIAKDMAPVVLYLSPHVLHRLHCSAALSRDKSCTRVVTHCSHTVSPECTHPRSALFMGEQIKGGYLYLVDRVDVGIDKGE